MSDDPKIRAVRNWLKQLREDGLLSQHVNVPELDALDATIAALEKQREPRCHWTLDCDPDRGESWDTSCGNKFEFTVSGPVENGFSFCPYCGGE